MKEVRISEGIQATIEILESIPVKVKDMETTGIAIVTAIRNLNSINQTVIAIEEKALANQKESSEKETPELKIVGDDNESEVLNIDFRAQDEDGVS